MKLNALFVVSLKKFIRNKKNIKNIIIISLMFSLIILCFSFKESLNNYWKDSVKKLVDYRTYIVNFDKSKYTPEEAIMQLKSYDHVIEAFDESSYLISMKVQDDDNVPSDNSILLVGTIPEPIKIVEGNNLNDTSINEFPIICAKQFYPFIENEQKDYITSKSIDITDKIGTTLNLSFIMSEEREKFKIVGLYDAKQNHTEGNVCYTRLDVVNKLNKKYQSEIFSSTNSELDYVYMVIDDIANEEIVSNEIGNEGFNILMPTLKLNKDMGNQTLYLMFIISGIIVFLSIVIIIFLLIKNINKRKTDYIIMKASGYSNKQIISTYIVEIIFEFLISFICSMLLYGVILIFFNKIYISDKIVFYNLKIGISILSLYINIIVSIFISIIVLIYFKYRLKKY